jgi:hypothetical protein
LALVVVVRRGKDWGILLEGLCSVEVSTGPERPGGKGNMWFGCLEGRSVHGGFAGMVHLGRGVARERKTLGCAACWLLATL